MDQHNNPSPSFINIAVLLLFALVIAVASSVTTYFVLSSKSNEQYSAAQPPVIPPPQTNVFPTTIPTTITQTVSDETTNWKVYRNEKYGFEIKYPPNLQVNDKQNDQNLFYDKNSNLIINMRYDLAPTERGFEEVIKPQPETGYGDPHLIKKEYIQESKTNIYSEWDFIPWSGGQRLNLIKADFLKGIDNKSQHGPFYDIVSPELNNEKYKEIFREMLSTFKFLE